MIKRAFTLIELVIVIVLIGVLAGIAAVTYSSIVGSSSDAAAESYYTQTMKVLAASSAQTQSLPAPGSYDRTDLFVSTDTASTLPASQDLPLLVDSVILTETSSKIAVSIRVGDTTCSGGSLGPAPGQSQISDISCAVLEDNSSPIPNWDAAASYQVGDVVTFNGITYECVQDYVGVGDPNYINALSLWQPLP